MKFHITHLKLLIILVTFVIFLPSFNTFYTNDDFFLLKISKAETASEYVNFYNFSEGPEGLGMYRPLTIQSFYFLGNKFPTISPQILHIIAYTALLLISYLIFVLVKILIKNNSAAAVAAFLYATSATHFGHMYYLATFQELGVTLFCLLSVLFFMNYLSNAKMKYYLLSLFTFILALLSKETAVVLPLLVVIVTIFTSYHNNTDKSINRYIGVTIPYFLILTGYLYQHFFVYGLATGDSYIWDFSLRKLANSTTWYALWSMGLPEMLVDFVGPGMRINPNLFLYWGSQITVILFLFTLLILLLTLKTYQHYIHRTRTHLVRVAVFSGIWFGVCLLPVIFLPLHKFSFYLTLPLFGVVLSIGYLFKDSKVGSPTAIIFLFIWTALQIYTLKLTVNTHWITRGAVVAQAVYKHIETNKTDFAGKQLVFVDTPEDELLPWSPTEVVKVALSDLNFFKHYYGDSIMAMYGGETKVGVVRIISRQFLGY